MFVIILIMVRINLYFSVLLGVYPVGNTKAY